MKKLTITLKPSQAIRLRHVAKHLGITPACLIRRAIAMRIADAEAALYSYQYQARKAARQKHAA